MKAHNGENVLSKVANKIFVALRKLDTSPADVLTVSAALQVMVYYNSMEFNKTEEEFAQGIKEVILEELANMKHPQDNLGKAN